MKWLIKVQFFALALCSAGTTFDMNGAEADLKKTSKRAREKTVTFAPGASEAMIMLTPEQAPWEERKAKLKNELKAIVEQEPLDFDAIYEIIETARYDIGVDYAIELASYALKAAKEDYTSSRLDKRQQDLGDYLWRIYAVGDPGLAAKWQPLLKLYARAEVQNPPREEVEAKREQENKLAQEAEEPTLRLPPVREHEQEEQGLLSLSSAFGKIK